MTDTQSKPQGTRAELQQQLETEQAANAELRERVRQLTNQIQHQQQALANYERQLLRAAPMLTLLAEGQDNYTRQLEGELQRLRASSSEVQDAAQAEPQAEG